MRMHIGKMLYTISDVDKYRQLYITIVFHFKCCIKNKCDIRVVVSF